MLFSLNPLWAALLGKLLLWKRSLANRLTALMSCLEVRMELGIAM